MEDKIICNKCRKELVRNKVSVEYMGFKLQDDILQCPECGAVYFDEEIVRTRMANVERELEDK